MNKPLLSALPELKRKKPDESLRHQPSHARGYNQALDDLSKYELCEEELAVIINTLSMHDSTCKQEIDVLMGNSKIDNCSCGRERRANYIAKSIISSSHLWIKRKDVK